MVMIPTETLEALQAESQDARELARKYRAAYERIYFAMETIRTDKYARHSNFKHMECTVGEYVDAAMKACEAILSPTRSAP